MLSKGDLSICIYICLLYGVYFWLRDSQAFGLFVQSNHGRIRIKRSILIFFRRNWIIKLFNNSIIQNLTPRFLNFFRARTRLRSYSLKSRHLIFARHHLHFQMKNLFLRHSPGPRLSRNLILLHLINLLLLLFLLSNLSLFIQFQDSEKPNISDNPDDFYYLHSSRRLRDRSCIIPTRKVDQPLSEPAHVS